MSAANQRIPASYSVGAHGASTRLAIAAQLDDALSVSYLSNDFAEAGEARQSLVVTAALCATVGRTVADAASRLHAIDSELPGFMPFAGD